MNDYSDLFRVEIQNLISLLKRAYSIDFLFLNRDINSEKTTTKKFEDDRVVFEDLEGNPLKLQHLVNLNESFMNGTDKISKIFNKSFFNLNAICPWHIDRYQKIFLDKFIIGKEYQSLFKNSVCLIDGKFRLKGFAKSDKPDHLKILKVERNSKIVLKSSNKMKISEILNDPRYKDTHHSVDATYIFHSGEFQVQWKNCFNLFDWPDLLADCNMKIRVDPHREESTLHQILEEIQQLQIINSAVEEDRPSWSLVGNKTQGLNVNQFKCQLNDLLQSDDKVPIDGLDKMSIWNRNVYLRERDITEILWTLFQKIDNKQDYKQCVYSMMSVLSENTSKVKFNPNNTTEFCRMLKERFLRSEVMIASFMTNLELMVQVGLYKLTKDLLFIISNELPDLSQDEMTEIFNKCCRVDQLHTGIESLNNLFTCISYMEILKDVLIPQDFKIEATAVVSQFIEGLNGNRMFELEQRLNIKMRAVNTKLRSLSSVWIINFISTEPIHSHKAVVFEVENDSTEFHIYRHDMELSEMRLYG